MNFKFSEINKWYQTKSGVINASIIIDSINRIFNISNDKKILYLGEDSIITTIMNSSDNFNSFYLSNTENADIRGELRNLPFEESSIDCIIIIHSLDCEKDPHTAFREIDRVLKEDGEIIISGFNKMSFLGIFSMFPIKSIFRNKKYITIGRLSDWMKLFSYEIKHILNVNKIPPFKNQRLINLFYFLNNDIFSKINFFGNSYIFFVNKKTYKYISVKNWHKKDNIILGKFDKPVVHNNYEK